jgi:hypothetical protein
MVNKAGGSGFQITAYTQTANDILAGMGDKAKAGQVAGNFNNLIMLKVKTKDTAEYLTELLQEVQVSTVTAVSRATDSSDISNNVMFSSSNEDRETKESVSLLTPNNLISLPKGQAYAYIASELYKIRLPYALPEEDLPDGLQVVADDMAKRYTPETPEDWFSSNDYGWYNNDADKQVAATAVNSEKHNPYISGNKNNSEGVNVQ